MAWKWLAVQFFQETWVYLYVSPAECWCREVFLALILLLLLNRSFSPVISVVSLSPWRRGTVLKKGRRSRASRRRGAAASWSASRSSSAFAVLPRKLRRAYKVHGAPASWSTYVITVRYVCVLYSVWASFLSLLVCALVLSRTVDYIWFYYYYYYCCNGSSLCWEVMWFVSHCHTCNPRSIGNVIFGHRFVTHIVLMLLFALLFSNRVIRIGTQPCYWIQSLSLKHSIKSQSTM